MLMCIYRLPTSITSLVNTLGNVGRLRQTLLPKIIPNFMTFYKTAHSSVSHTQVVSVLYALKYNFVVFLRYFRCGIFVYNRYILD
jgi:hypothetical protein